MVKVDTDSDPIGINNRWSVCISHKIEDFIDSPTESKRVIEGLGSTHMNNIMIGIIQ